MYLYDSIDAMVWLEKVNYEQIAVSEEMSVAYFT